ncbi:serine protein kinase RIO [Specibacter cremeus]|uniref:serine protein kinase RIO n=1 Tax=Specibacter cremeus TaxID=1629051 RepID=UPI000F768887|nr:RIO1 family regulatory kinase/ATPase [Specibacter cremeus]
MKFPADHQHHESFDRPPDWNVLDETLEPGQRWSAWPELEKLMRGPQPYPPYIIEDAGAVDTDLGVLKTGKEADVYLIERAAGKRRTLFAAKRYRTDEHRLFHRSSIYNEGRSVRRSRDARAISKGSTYGRAFEAMQWASAEWTYLRMAWEHGVPVPYPVQNSGTEIMMEFIEDPDHPGAAAPRLQQLHPDPDRLAGYRDQLVDAMHAFARMGFAHGDLSPYNVLAAGDRLVVIDLPQLVDLAGNLQASDLLARDCKNMCDWFTARGLPMDAGELLGELLATAW